MKNILTIFDREIKAYFNSPIAYIFIVVFLFMSAGLFMTRFFLISNADMRAFFSILPVILCVFIPAITMRLWADDRRGNTLELLLTFPMNTHELVIGKFFASVVFYSITLLSTLPIVLMLIVLGSPDLGAILCQYLGAFLLGSFFLALGIFISGFCKDQIVSFILAMIACFGLFLLGTDLTAGSIDGWIPGLGSFLRTSISMTGHFNTFQKGIIDIRDVLYFVIGAAIFLTLNSFWLESRLRPKAKSVFSTTLLVSCGIFILVNLIVSDISIGRFDYTEGNIYTISKATREILNNLKAPVTAKLFISSQEKMPAALKTLERDLRDKLDEFKVASNGRFKYKVFHMEAANVSTGEESLEESIEKKGIRPFQVKSIEADELGIKLIYSAISIAYKEKTEEIISQIMPQSLFDLEYELISKIHRMTLKEIPKLALVAPYTEKPIDEETKRVLAMFGQQAKEKFREDDYELLPKALQYEGYEVSRIKLTEDEPIPEDVKTLIVVDPKDLNDRQRFEINRFLVNGGSVFLATQHYEFGFQGIGRGGANVSATDKQSGINELLNNWGLGINKDILMDTQAEFLSLSSGSVFGVFPVTQPVKTPMQIKIVPDQMNKDFSITSHIPSLFYLWGSALDIKQDKIKELGLEVKTLFTSSSESWTIPHHPGSLTKKDMKIPGSQDMKEFPLAVFVKGQLPDAFEGKDVPEWPKDEEGEEDESYEEPLEGKNLDPKPGKLILIGCSEMFTKQLFNGEGHVSFFLNAIDSITLGDQLIGVRSKASIDRPLKNLSTTAKAAWRIFIIILIPIILCIVGGLRIIFRKRLKHSYLKTIEG